MGRDGAESFAAAGRDAGLKTGAPGCLGQEPGSSRRARKSATLSAADATCPSSRPRSGTGDDVILGPMRHFNTEGPVEAAEHYLIPPLERIDREQILTLIRRRKYFVLHAPRQTGKTSTLLALRDLLNSGSEGDFRCVYASFEMGRTDRGRGRRKRDAAHSG